MLSDIEWFELFCNDYEQLEKVMETERRDEKFACYKCFRSHSKSQGRLGEIINTMLAE